MNDAGLLSEEETSDDDTCTAADASLLQRVLALPLRIANPEEIAQERPESPVEDDGGLLLCSTLAPSASVVAAAVARLNSAGPPYILARAAMFSNLVFRISFFFFFFFANLRQYRSLKTTATAM